MKMIIRSKEAGNKGSILFIGLITYFFSDLILQLFGLPQGATLRLAGISIIPPYIISALIFINLFANFQKLTHFQYKLLRRYVLYVYLFLLFGLWGALMNGNDAYWIVQDTMSIFGFLTGVCIAASSQRYDNEKAILFIFYGLCLLLITYYAINLNAYATYISKTGLLRLVSPFVFYVQAPITLLVPLAMQISSSNKKSFHYILVRVLILLVLVIIMFGNVTKSSAVVLIFGYLFIIFGTQSNKRIKHLIQGTAFYSIAIFGLIFSLMKLNLPFQRMIESFSYRFLTDVDGNSSISARIVEISEMFNSFTMQSIFIGNGLGSTFTTFTYTDMPVINNSPHIGIFTPFLKIGALGFILISIVPIFFVIYKLFSIPNNNRNRIISFASSILTYYFMSMLSGGWAYLVLLILGYCFYMLSLSLKD